jgi:hypothetical protein
MCAGAQTRTRGSHTSAKRLKDIRLGIVYLPSPYREEALNFPVSIGAGKP